MKKIFLSLLISIIAFSVFSQEPNHNKTPKLFHPGNWYMVGNWDSISGSYKDTIGYYLESDTIYHWSNKYFRHNGSFSATRRINTDSSYYINNIKFIKYNIATKSTGIGENCLDSSMAGANNIGIGYNALSVNSTGIANISIGTFTLKYNKTGSYNIAIGYNALGSTLSSYNTAIGTSLVANTTGKKNTSVGMYSLMNNTTDSSNIALGYKAGYNATFSNRLWIGQGDSNNAIIYGEMLTHPRIRFNGDVYLKNKLSFPIFSATIADTLTPTEAELTTAIGLTPAQAGSGGSFVVKSTSGCLYDIISDGTNYYCTKRKKLW